MSKHCIVTLTLLTGFGYQTNYCIQLQYASTIHALIIINTTCNSLACTFIAHVSCWCSQCHLLSPFYSKVGPHPHCFHSQQQSQSQAKFQSLVDQAPVEYRQDTSKLYNDINLAMENVGDLANLSSRDYTLCHVHVYDLHRCKHMHGVTKNHLFYLIMPRCACASEVYGSVFVCLCVCVCVQSATAAQGYI